MALNVEGCCVRALKKALYKSVFVQADIKRCGMSR
jgi:hypothetical protein